MLFIIGERLKELRKNNGEKQETVAEIIGVTRSAVSAYESGIRQPDLDTLIRLARHYHVSTDFLLGITDTVIIDRCGLTEHDAYLINELIISLRRN